MDKIINRKYNDERSLFKSDSLEIDNCSFDVGESPLKESKNLIIRNSSFLWKYPLWYCNNVKLIDSVLGENARAGIWYTTKSKFENLDIKAPKLFRKCNDITISNCDFKDGIETLWWNNKVTLRKVKASGNYFGLGCSNIDAEDIFIDGLYAFDGLSNSHIRKSKLVTKDAFWNSNDLVIEDSYIECEYFGWNSKNITLINCEIKSHQGFCYMDNIKLVNCRLSGDLMFEYCTNINADVINVGIESIKNPISGKIILDKKCNLIDDEVVYKKMKIEVK